VSLHSDLLPDKALQRTRLRAPLSFKTLGVSKGRM